MLAALESFEVTDEDEITLAFSPPPNQSEIGGIMAGLGHEDFTIQSQALNSFTIRTSEALTTDELNAIREAFDSQIGIVTGFNATGGLEEAKRLIRGTAQLVFMERNCLVPLDELVANPRLCEPIEAGGLGQMVDKDIGLTGEDLSRAFPGRDPTTNLPLVNVQFNSRGTEIFRELTRRLFEMGELGRIAIFLDDQQISAPVVRSPILDGRAVIQGGFTNETANELAIQLESGRLPVPLTLIKERTVDALLGADSLRRSLIAGLVGLGLVLAFMMVYYRMAGVVAAVSLLVYAVIVMAIFKLIPVTLTLSGIAGVVLSIGMAVDANILIFERMKEEMRTGRTLTSAMEVGFRRAWTAIQRQQRFHHHNLSHPLVVRRPAWSFSGDGLRHHPSHRSGRQHVHGPHGEPQSASDSGFDTHRKEPGPFHPRVSEARIGGSGCQPPGQLGEE